MGITNTGLASPPGQAPSSAGNEGGPISQVTIINASMDENGSSFGTTNTNHLFYSATSGDISWDAAFLVPYDAASGGYHFNLYAFDGTRATTFTDVTADFSHTFQLTSVTQADGSALTGPIAFDSGYQLPSAVPEPSSLVLMGIAGITGLGYAWRRHRAQIVA